jgi:starch synthase
MSPPLRICFAASEAAPLAKTGGLADVAGALPRELRQRGIDARLFLPAHAQLDTKALEGREPRPAGEISLSFGKRRFVARLLESRLPASELPVYLVDCPPLFHRDSLYTDDEDEGRRFVYFSRAVIEGCQRLGWAPDLFHCHDWHAALIPLLLRSTYAWDALFEKSRSILTIHNMGYQGNFAADDLAGLGLSETADLLDPAELANNRVGFLRSGIVHADRVTTVSPTYAEEIRTAEYGMGLEGVLAARADGVSGILNGVDYEHWSPERDCFIPHRYSRTRLAGKAKNKEYLLRSLELRSEPGPPLAGIVSRLAYQKGFELCFTALPELIAESELRLVVLGEGERDYVQFFRSLATRHPERVHFHRGYHEELAHLIEAGSDLFLMPSRYEPCGLNQMFSLRYGTIPVVRRTGGLADSVEPFDRDTGEGTGFVFTPFTAEALRAALDDALACYEQRDKWQRLIDNAMRKDFSWDAQAAEYEALYRATLR